MTDLPTISDHRWEGYDPAGLVDLVNKVKGGPGAAAMNHAMDALRAAAQAVAELDGVLRDQLGKLGVDWQGTAGDQAKATVTQSADYANAANPKLDSSRLAVDLQGEAHSYAKNNLPNSKELNFDQHYQENFGDKVDHFFGYETDHDKQVKTANAAKAVVVQQMYSYTDSARTNLASYEPLAQPPSMNLQTQPADAPSGSVASSTSGQAGYSSHADAPVAFGRTQGGGGGTSSGGTSSGGLGIGDSGGTGGGGTDGHGGLREGGRVSAGPIPGSDGSTSGVVGSGLPSGRLDSGRDLAAGAGIGLSVGAGAGAGAAALNEGDGGSRIARGLEGRAPSGRGQRSSGTAGAGPAEGVPAQERAIRSGMPATGGAASRGSSSMMQPAATNKDTEEDKEHVRKYGVESSDVFDDNRLVVPTVIGETETQQQRTEHQ